MDRKKGYYWVKRFKEAEWEVALWYHNEWQRTGTDDSFWDEQFFVIGSRLQEPNE